MGWGVRLIYGGLGGLALAIALDARSRWGARPVPLWIRLYRLRLYAVSCISLTTGVILLFK